MGDPGRVRRGFTLIEAGVVGVVVAVIGMQVAPAVRHARNSARGAGSASNLMQIGQGAGMYAQDNAGRIFSYSLPGLQQLPKGSLPITYDLPDGTTVRTRSDLESADVQETELVQRLTGRTSGGYHYFYGRGLRLSHRRRIGLVLLDYLGRGLDDPLFADPADANQLRWIALPLEYDESSTVPYAQGIQPGYDTDGNWSIVEVRQRWAFSSSYLTTTSAWQGDGLSGENVFVPNSTTPHLFDRYSPTSPSAAPVVPLAEGRNLAEVRFPSAKVYFFEEHDREQAGDPYFAYDHAAPEKLMFDGSVNSWASGGARSSWNPEFGKQEWRQTYVPLDKFPIPLGGLGDDTLLSQRYRWTLGGLQGLDYVRPPMPGR